MEALAGTRGTESRLDGTDIDKNFGPDLPLLFIMHEIWSVDHGLRGSASPLLTATGLVNGRWRFSTPYSIDTP